MNVKITKTLSLGRDSIGVNGVELITIDNLVIEKGEVAEVVTNLDNGWIVDLYGDSYFIPFSINSYIFPIFNSIAVSFIFFFS